MSDEGKRQAFAFSEAIAPAGRPMPVVPMEGKRKYLRRWGAWQYRAQTPAERRSALQEAKAVMWGGMMQREPAVVVVDFDDPAKMRDWAAAAHRRYTVEVPTPVWVTTGRAGDGAHLYYRVEGEAPSLETRTQRVGYDLKGAAGLVVLPGSAHATGRRYVLKVDGAAADPRRFGAGELHARLPPFPLAGHLADLQRLGLTGGVARGRSRRDLEADRFIEDDGEALVIARRVCRWHLRERGPAVAGEGGHTKTMSLLHFLGDLGVPDHVAFVAACEWNCRNAPPWCERDLKAKLHDAYWGTHRRDPLGHLMVDVARIVVDLGA